MFWSGAFLGAAVGIFFGVLLTIAVCGSETAHAIDHRLAEKIKGDKPDIDIEVR